MNRRGVLLVTGSLLSLVLFTGCGGASVGPARISAGDTPAAGAGVTRPPQPSPSPVPSAATPTARPVASISFGHASGGAGSIVTASPSTALSPSSTRSPGPTGSETTTKLDESSSGTMLRLHRGDTVEVSLPGGAQGGYVRPTSSTDSLNRSSASGGYPSDQPARATFVAVKAGSADLSAQTDYTCLHSNPRCLPPQRQWIVHVIVTA